LKKDPEGILIAPEVIEEGGLTEDQYLDLDLDRNYEYQDDNLIQNFNNIGWDDPWDNVDFHPVEKREQNALKKRKKERDKENAAMAERAEKEEPEEREFVSSAE